MLDVRIEAIDTRPSQAGPQGKRTDVVTHACSTGDLLLIGFGEVDAVSVHECVGIVRGVNVRVLGGAAYPGGTAV